MKFLSTVTELITSPALWVGLGIGLGVGAVIRLPLIQYTLPPDIANVVGAFSGAAVAVSGAWWIASSDRRRVKRELHALVLRFAKQTLEASLQLEKVVADHIRAKRREFVPPDGLGMNLYLAASVFEKKIEDLSADFEVIGIGGRIAYGNLLERVRDAAEIGEYFWQRSNIDLDLDNLPLALHSSGIINQRLRFAIDGVVSTR